MRSERPSKMNLRINEHGSSDAARETRREQDSPSFRFSQSRRSTFITFRQIRIEIDHTRIRFSDIFCELIDSISSRLVEVMNRSKSNLESKSEEDDVC